jgi:Xaa-Pro dipeptidase
VLHPGSLPALQDILADLGLDGWLLLDFQGTNPIAAGVLGLKGMLTRRHLAWVPRKGVPVAIVSAIEPGVWPPWPGEWRWEPYTGWRELEAALARAVGGRRVAMEYCAGNAIPYLDRVPAGAVEMVRAAGAEVVSSGDVVSRFYAVWTEAHLASHGRAAERIAGIAREAIARAGAAARAGTPLQEHELLEWIVGALGRAGLEFEAPPMVAAGPGSADVHYAPSAARARAIGAGEVLLVDLWAREPGGVYADQTWMGVMGRPTPRMTAVWDAERAARDAVIALVRGRVEAGLPVRGSEAHDEARRVLAAAGFLPYAVGRAGHSIDPRQLHGAGPNLDSVETRDDRALLPGTGFSIEPGIYLPGEFGMRSEVNAWVGPGTLVVTPAAPQVALLGTGA